MGRQSPSTVQVDCIYYSEDEVEVDDDPTVDLKKELAKRWAVTSGQCRSLFGKVERMNMHVLVVPNTPERECAPAQGH